MSILAALGAGVGVASGISNVMNRMKNFDLQREQYNYQKELNQTMMNREDTAVQRRVADLQAAGLSPTLAAGSAASAHAGDAGAAPQKEMSELEIQSVLTNLAQQNADISKTYAEKERIEMQTEIDWKNYELDRERLLTNRQQFGVTHDWNVERFSLEYALNRSQHELDRDTYNQRERLQISTIEANRILNELRRTEARGMNEHQLTEMLRREGVGIDNMRKLLDMDIVKHDFNIINNTGWRYKDSLTIYERLSLALIEKLK